MVDYVQLLARAVATLDPNAPEQRDYVYDRARQALAERFRASDPDLSGAEFRAQLTALEAAIGRVEADVAVHAAPPPPDAGEESYEAPVEEYDDRPPLAASRTHAGVIAGVIGVLAVVLAGVMVYSFWPDIRSTAHSTLRASNVATPAEQRVDDKNYIYMRQLVYYRTNYPVGTLVVDKPQSFLYVVRPSLAAMRYTINVNTDCSDLVGLYRVVRKEEWPPVSYQVILSNSRRISLYLR